MNNRQVEDASAPSISSFYENHGTIRCESVNNNDGPDDALDQLPFSTEDSCVEFFAPEVSTTDDQYAIKVNQKSDNDQFIDFFNTYMLDHKDKNCSIFIPDYKDTDWNRKGLRHTIKESKNQEVQIFGTYRKVPDVDFKNCIDNGFDYAVKKQAQYNREQDKAAQEFGIIFGSIAGGLLGSVLLLVCIYFTVKFTRNKYEECVSNSEKKKLIEQPKEENTRGCNFGTGFSKCVSILFHKEDAAVADYKSKVNGYGTINL